MAEQRCCHDPMGNTHWKGEPETCCHSHIENMPSNHAQRGEVEHVPTGWTAQAQARVDELTTKIAEAEQQIEDTEEVPAPVHRHTSKGT